VIGAGPAWDAVDREVPTLLDLTRDGLVVTCSPVATIRSAFAARSTDPRPSWARPGRANSTALRTTAPHDR
jgi:hypothetical protein